MCTDETVSITFKHFESFDEFSRRPRSAMRSEMHSCGTICATCTRSSNISLIPLITDPDVGTSSKHGLLPMFHAPQAHRSFQLCLRIVDHSPPTLSIVVCIPPRKRSSTPTFPLTLFDLTLDLWRSPVPDLISPRMPPMSLGLGGGGGEEGVTLLPNSTPPKKRQKMTKTQESDPGREESGGKPKPQTSY